MSRTSFPTKTRELHNHHFDSTIWNEFRFRDDDIVISTYAKSGTTWMQQIIAQLLFNGAERLDVAEMSPWLDLPVPPKEDKLPLVEAQSHRRFLKPIYLRTRWYIATRQSKSTLAVTAAMLYGAFIIIIGTLMPPGMKR